MEFGHYQNPCEDNPGYSAISSTWSELKSNGSSPMKSPIEALYEFGGVELDYSSYESLLIEVKDGIALLTMNRPEVFNATDSRLHNELSRIWADLGKDPEVKVAVITGAGNAFSAGGDFGMLEKTIGNPEEIAGQMQEAAIWFMA